MAVYTIMRTIALLLLFTAPAAAQDPKPVVAPKTSLCQVQHPTDTKGNIIKSPFGLGVYFEQDDLLPWLARWSDDRNYTMGLAFPAVGHWIHRSRLDLALRGMDCLTGFNRSHNDQINAGDAIQDFGLVFGNTAFTPERYELPEAIPDDRPFASLLFLTAVRTTVNPHARRVLRTEMTLGALGLGISESVQTDLHIAKRRGKGPDAVSPPDPKGWPHQISDGGEPTAKYTVALAKAAQESMWHDVSWQGEASAGYYTNVAGGALVRAGYLRSPFWGLNSNPLSGANQRVEGVSAGDLDSRRADRPFELAGFGALRIRLVGYNALLQGQFRHSDVRLTATQVSHVMLEGEAGVSLGIKACALVATVARRSPEYSVGRPRAHTFGGVHLTCAGSRRK